MILTNPRGLYSIYQVIQQASARPASILAVSREILVTEGARGFFKGMLYPVITAGAINSVFFGVYGVCMDKMKVKCF